jgi:membrane protein DedA with SNARE-associated domain
LVRALVEQFVGYPALWLACVTSGILAPMPEDFPLVYAGARVAEGSWTWPAALAVAFLGVGLRDLIAWSVGRLLGDWLLHRESVRRIVGRRSIDRARRMVTRHGAWAVLIGRFLVGFRAPVFAVAGAMGVPLRSFAGIDALGLMVAVPLAMLVGYEFGAAVAVGLATVVERARWWVAGAVIVAVAVLAWRRSAALASAAGPIDEGEEPL